MFCYFTSFWSLETQGLWEHINKNLDGVHSSTFLLIHESNVPGMYLVSAEIVNGISFHYQKCSSLGVKWYVPSTYIRMCPVYKKELRQTVSLSWFHWAQDSSNTKPESSLLFSTSLDQVWQPHLQGTYTFTCICKGGK